jgi:large exoprotein involved in heme utilization and adhesion
VTTTVRQSTSTESSSLVWQRLTDRGSVTETAMALPSFVGGVEFSAPGGLSVQVPQSADLKTQIAALSAQPGMGYLGDLAARSDVNWQQVKLAHESWDHTREGLTPAGAALLSVAVAWATGPMGANLIGATAGTTTGAMANAAFSSLASQAAITLINNKGDIGKTLRDLGRSSTAKAALAAALSAGFVQQVAQSAGVKAVVATLVLVMVGRRTA